MFKESEQDLYVRRELENRDKEKRGTTGEKVMHEIRGKQIYRVRIIHLRDFKNANSPAVLAGQQSPTPSLYFAIILHPLLSIK